jgi:hypothetical protein
VNPAEHSARNEAERLGVIVGSDVDRVEDALLTELHGDPIEQLPIRPLALGGFQRGSGRRFLPGQCHLHPSGAGCRCTQ